RDGSASNGGTASTGVTNGVNGNQVGTSAQPIDPHLGVLQNNGGPTPTMALLPGSPAIDAGANNVAPSYDQRGFARPVNGIADIGAYEFQPPATLPPFVSVAFGPAGEVVDVVSSDGVLTQYDAFGTHVLGGGVRFASLAFGPSGAVMEVVALSGVLT